MTGFVRISQGMVPQTSFEHGKMRVGGEGPASHRGKRGNSESFQANPLRFSLKNRHSRRNTWVDRKDLLGIAL